MAQQDQRMTDAGKKSQSLIRRIWLQLARLSHRQDVGL